MKRNDKIFYIVSIAIILICIAGLAFIFTRNDKDECKEFDLDPLVIETVSTKKLTVYQGNEVVFECVGQAEIGRDEIKITLH